MQVLTRSLEVILSPYRTRAASSTCSLATLRALLQSRRAAPGYRFEEGWMPWIHRRKDRMWSWDFGELDTRFGTFSVPLPSIRRLWASTWIDRTCRLLVRFRSAISN